MLKRLDHIGVVVDNLEEIKALFTFLGGPPALEVDVPGASKTAFYRYGDVSIVLLEPPDAGNKRERLVNGVAARIDHVCFEVDSLDETIRELETWGARLAPTPFTRDETDDALSTFGELRQVFTRPDTTHGLTLQFVEAEAGVAEAIAAAASRGAGLGSNPRS